MQMGMPPLALVGYLIREHRARHLGELGFAPTLTEVLPAVVLQLPEAGNEVVTPIDNYDNGVGNIIIHIGNISKEADYNKLKPLIQRWILEASSRRGSV